MKVIQLNSQTFPGVLFEAVQVVKSGGVIIYPTDTVYGIGGNALDPSVAEKVLAIKQRPRDKGLILLVKSHADARKYAYIDLWTERILEELWPGPVSVVLHKRDNVPDIVAAPNGTVALRMPDSRFAGELLRQVNVPLIATATSKSEDSNAAAIVNSFLEHLENHDVKPDLVIDAGPLESLRPSTIIDLTNKKNPLILRKGVITKEEFEAMFQPK